MTYRSILVHLDDSPRCPQRVALAASLALTQGAHLLGLSPTGVVSLPPSMQPQVTAMQAARDEMKARATERVRRFEAQVASLGLLSHEGRVHDDDTLSAVLQHARGCDLVVLGQHDPQQATPLVSWDLPQQIFLHSGRPVLVVPYAGDFSSTGHKVVVAFSDSRETARAMADALPILRQAQQVDVISFNEPASAPQQAMHEWLQRQGVKAKVHIESTEMDIGNALLSRAFDLGADLIVMGGYGHSRVAELVVGGVTRTVLSQMTVPVLISH